MKLNVNLRNVFLEITCLLYIVLFVYAAISKVLDFENFQVQLGQSPLLSSFAGFISYMVPITELTIAFLLCFERFRIIAIYSAFSLMVMFTVYIVIILNFSPFIPCSCGGILEKLSWQQHLIFNIAFVFLGFGSILLFPTEEKSFKTKKSKISIIVASSSIGVMIALFLLSEDMIHHRNNFIRRFPHHPAVLKHNIDLKQTTYYIAGIEKNKIFLGNTHAPLVMTVVDTTLQHQKTFKITLPENKFDFRSVRVKVVPPYFYVSDGTVPVIFRGYISNWKASLYMHGDAYFTHMEPITDKRMLIRAISGSNGENILGTIVVDTKTEVKISDQLLQKQIDGIFDTDGTMIYNDQMDKMIYTYFYRNEFIIADTLLHLTYRGHTIDTTTHAKIKVTYIKSRKESKLSSPPYVVNKNTATFGKYLFVHAGLMGKYEDRDIWKSASIVDVYNLLNKTYAFSFYIEDIGKKKMSDFKIDSYLLVSINGHYLSTYKLKYPFEL